MVRNLTQIIAVAFLATTAFAQSGSITGTVYDKFVEGPLKGARVSIIDLDVTVETNDRGGYSLTSLPPGVYKVVFKGEGFVNQVIQIPVSAGMAGTHDVWMASEFTEYEEYVVPEGFDFSAGSEAALLDIRFDSPALLDSIGSEFISQSGAGDAASALKFVAGASVKDGKSAVIRGLPDRYVASLINGIRVPTTDEDKRAVELDQFPSAIIESIIVSKTFVPSQQGDASGGAVNVKLKGIPDEEIFFKFSSQVSFNSQAAFRRDSFLADPGGGLNLFGFDNGSRDAQPIDSDWDGAVGGTGEASPLDHSWAMAFGGNSQIDKDTKIGGFVSFFYERDSSYYDNGKDHRYWVTDPGEPLTPLTPQGNAQQGQFITALFDVERAQKQLQWGGLASFGVETKHHKIDALFLYSRTVTDTVLRLEDTTGKEYFFPGHDPNDPTSPGHEDDEGEDLRFDAPYLRYETIDYSERQTGSLQFHGSHEVPVDELFSIGKAFTFTGLEVDWSVAYSFADLNQPDKRQIASDWTPRRIRQIGNFTIEIPAAHRPIRPQDLINIGNVQRIYKTIEEESTQVHFNLKLPYTQWNDLEGYFKIGAFRDSVQRVFDQDNYSNANEQAGLVYEADFDDLWSQVFDEQVHEINESLQDIDYVGELKVQAWYLEMQLPILENLKLTGGVRFEQTKVRTINDAEADARFLPPGLDLLADVNPSDIADASIDQFDVLPSIGIEYNVLDSLTLRASYNETLARQTFKELTPIVQSEFIGGPIFIGNPDLQISFVQSYDFRVDWKPFDGWLVSGSWFRKDIQDPIEYVQVFGDFSFTTPRNYTNGRLKGFEFEVRADLGTVWEPLTGLTLGANATLINARVDLTDDEVQRFAAIGETLRSRDMVNAPEYLYNLFATYEIPDWGTRLALFYSVTGDQLIAGAGIADGNFIPSLYQLEFGTLNFNLSQSIGDHVNVRFQWKNITNPTQQTALRLEGTDGDADVIATSFTAGMEFSLQVSAEFTF